MKEPYFEPWIGQNYESGEPNSHKKLWILTESHYTDVEIEVTEKFTQIIMDNYLKGKYEGDKLNIWDNIINAFYLLGRRSTFEERKAFWHSVMWSNFIQAQELPFKSRPTPEMWQEAKDPFLAVMNRHKPQRILCVGYEVWDHLPTDEKKKYRYGPTMPELEVGGDRNCTWVLPFEGVNDIQNETDYALAFPVRHASSYFRYSDFHKFIMCFLDMKHEDIVEAWSGKK